MVLVQAVIGLGL